MSLDDLKLRSKVLLPLALLTVALVAMVGFGAYQLSGISQSGQDISRRSAGALELASASRSLVYVSYSTFAGLVYDSDSEGGKAAKDNFDHAVERINGEFDAASALLPQEAAEIAAFKSRADALLAKAKPAFDRAHATPGVDHGADLKREDLVEMKAAAEMIAAVDVEARKLTDEIVVFNNRDRDASIAAAKELEASSIQSIVVLVAVGVLFALVAGAFALWVGSAKIAGPLARLAQQMKALANGDLKVKIAGAARRDEIGDMAQAVEVFKVNAIERQRAEAAEKSHRAEVESERERSVGERAKTTQAQGAAMEALCAGLEKLAEGDLVVRLGSGFSGEFVRVRDDFNAATQKLAETLDNVVQAIQNIRSGAQEISTASDDLSHRTEQQAASLEETAAAVEEITTTLKKSAEGARHAAEVVGAADKDAKEGAVVVKQAVEAMDAISKSSEQIGQIIGVIDEIAFQTNLLALNAGVEAARAGDAGKGFAVVASEVRGLAQRSAEAAKEIKALISTSGLQVETGVQLVADTGKALERIIVQVSEINSVVAQIASGAQEQASGLQEVNTAISAMDQTTQQNATMVEQSTAASHSLSQEAQRLSGLVAQFRLDDGRGAQLRRELEKAAPHAFAKPAPAKAAPAKTAPRPAAARPKAVAAGGSRASDDWNEF